MKFIFVKLYFIPSEIFFFFLKKIILKPKADYGSCKYIDITDWMSIKNERVNDHQYARLNKRSVPLVHKVPSNRSDVIIRASRDIFRCLLNFTNKSSIIWKISGRATIFAQAIGTHIFITILHDIF